MSPLRAITENEATIFCLKEVCKLKVLAEFNEPHTIYDQLWSFHHKTQELALKLWNLKRGISLHSHLFHVEDSEFIDDIADNLMHSLAPTCITFMYHNDRIELKDKIKQILNNCIIKLITRLRET